MRSVAFDLFLPSLAFGLISSLAVSTMVSATVQAQSAEDGIREKLCPKQADEAPDNYPPGAVGGHEVLPFEGISNRHLELLFNVTHGHNPSNQTEAYLTRLRLEIYDICADQTAKNVTYLLTIRDGATDNGDTSRPLITDVFETGSGILNLNVSFDNRTTQTRIFGDRDEILDAWKADLSSNSVTIKTSAMRPDGNYRMDIELMTIDSIRNMFASGEGPTAAFTWNGTDSSDSAFLNQADQLSQKPKFPFEPIIGLRTDKQSYTSGDIVKVLGNVGNATGKAIAEHKESPARIGVLGADPQEQFVLMDNISNVTTSGDFTYSFPMKGLGTIQAGRFSVQVWSPNGAEASTTYNYTYSAAKALSSNPTTVDWNDASTKHIFVDTYDERYVTNGSHLLSQSSDLAFSREMRYKIIPAGSADLKNLTGYHLKNGGNSILSTILEGTLKAQRNGTLIIDIPIDIVEPDPLKVRGLEWRMLNGSAPFSVDGYGGQQKTRLLYYYEVQNVVAIDFGPGLELFHVIGKSAEPITDSELQSGYVVPEFDSTLLVATVGLSSIVILALSKRHLSLFTD